MVVLIFVLILLLSIVKLFNNIIPSSVKINRNDSIKQPKCYCSCFWLRNKELLVVTFSCCSIIAPSTDIATSNRPNGPVTRPTIPGLPGPFGPRGPVSWALWALGLVVLKLGYLNLINSDWAAVARYKRL